MTKDFIKFNERAYKFIRGSAVSQIIDALVELITNSDDAYDKGKIKNKDIHIHLNYRGQLIVTDQAIGLTSDQMKKCFLQVGNFTSINDNRGFFSRGAKDISALGDIYFESIKDNKYSKLLLDKNANGELLISDQNVDNKLRDNLKIVKNGLRVMINLNDGVQIPNPKVLLEIYCRHISLRNILNNKNCKCTITFEDSPEFEFNYKQFKFNYSFPNTEVLLYLSYNLPSYPDADVFFQLSKSENQLFDDNNMKYCDWGILITSNKVIHDISCLNEQFKFNPYMKSLSGMIHSTYINKLLRDYDKNGASKLNPFPILDPSRVGGLNYDHPFMKELIKIPKDRLDLVLQELEVTDDNEYVFFNNEIMDIINKLNLTGDKFMEANELMKFVENKNSDLIRGIESDRGKFVTVEKNFIQDLNKSKRVNFDKKTKKNVVPYVDPMSKLFDIIGVGDEGNVGTDEVDKTTKLYKKFDKSIMKNVETENKKIFHFNNVEGKNEEAIKKEFESQNYQHLKKDNMFVIKFINSTQDRKYEIYQSGQKIILKININFPILKRYFNENDFSKDFETSKLEAIMLLHEILTEALTRIQLISYINRDFIKINNDSSSSNFQELFKNYDSYKNNIDISVDKVIQSIISQERFKIKKLIQSNDDQTITKNDQNIIQNDDNNDPIDDKFLLGLDNIQKTPENIEHDLGFIESKIQNENINLDDFILKDKSDKLTIENDKLKKENDKLKKENNEIKLDINELKEIMMENIESLVIKRFKRIEKFIDYSFLHSEDGYDFIKFYKITKVHISSALNSKFDKYDNLQIYDCKNDINEPTLFYGVYRPNDILLIKNHKGPKFVYWDDNDANINYSNRRDTLKEISDIADINLCNTMIVEKYLQIMNINYKKINFF